MGTLSAWAPSNIALVKYMGKLDGGGNLPENPSLSMTLDRLRTYVEIEPTGATGAARWVPELPAAARAHAQAAVPALSAPGQARFLAHLERVRAALPRVFAPLGLELAERSSQSGDGLVVRTANTFPAASGIASSASSFAALTLAAAAAFARDTEAFRRALAAPATDASHLRRSLAALARQGSGSSCRSLEGPFVAWDGEHAELVPSAPQSLTHFVVLADAGEKAVSSSDAHRRVKSSPLWRGRPERARDRVVSVRRQLASGDRGGLARLTWSEMWEMHSLFHTAEEPFSYFVPDTVRILRRLAPELSRERPPVVTLDAGPNVHVTVEARDRDEWLAFFQQNFPELSVLEDRPGKGGELL
jgi:diphosphomevalonate decarboxylase